MHARRIVASGLLTAMLAGASPALAAESGLSNLSTRGQVGTGGNIMVGGFAIADGPKQVLIRGIGPGLTQHGVTGVLADPVLTLFDADGVALAMNDDWTAGQAAVFETVGAFALPPGSKDAALVMTLDAGTYTTHVEGADGGTGISLVEVYEVGGDAGVSRLVNLSARAIVGTGDAVMIPGLVIAGPGNARRLLVRAAGPALADFGVADFLADPFIALVDGDGVTLFANDDWGAGDEASLLATTTQAGAFAFTPADSKDAALLAEINPGSFTIQVSGVGGATGVALVEVYDVTPAGPPATLTIETVDAVSDESGSNSAEFVVTRTGDTSQPLIARYSTGGTAFNGLDYLLLNGLVTIPVGEVSAAITVSPIPDLDEEPVEDVSITLVPGLGYVVGAAGSASASITSVPPILYVASLRPEDAVPSSTAYGTATILLSASGTLASVNVSFSNLSSAQTTAYLRLGAPGETGAYILPLPLGQVTGAIWQLKPTGTFSAEDLLEALQTGFIYVGIETANHPTGELRGLFIESAGSQVFVPPPAPPSAPTAPVTQAEAARFLTQATFGSTTAAIEALMQQSFSGWIDQQMAVPVSVHRTLTMSDFAANNAGGQLQDSNGVNQKPGRVHRQSAWWQIAVNGADQLRQRVAFALSEVFVISDQNSTVNNRQEGAAHYYDILAGHAFGNFRALLGDVSLSPMMGVYLSHLRNAKANPSTGALPDENYAREVMQLFSVGLVQLQPDGTLLLNSGGLPVPTYDQTTITETAKVFTGWAYKTDNPTDLTFRRGPIDEINPMSLYPTQHETGAKTIIGGVVLPAGQGGVADLEDTLDTLFNHANTGPFICRRLIQRLVTSNPSPAYVYRVAQVFSNNGSGVRGDLGAVVRAILLDYEARSPEVAANAGFGKLKEPLLRVTGLLRAFAATDTDGRFNFGNPQNTLEQAALGAPSVFNFFEPDYVHPGALTAAGLFAPEYQILTDSTALSIPNQLYTHIFGAPSGISISNAALVPLVGTPAALVDAVALLLASGSLSVDASATIVNALNALPGSASTEARIDTAIYLVVNAPGAAIQK